jgi:uracil-DNA glycosylase
MIIGNNWDVILKEEYQKDYFKKLVIFMRNEYKAKRIYPKANDIFNALKHTDYDNVKVVILGQDPYHNEGEAHGLAFSVAENVKLPPSLINIYKELQDDLGIVRVRGNLDDWAKQGILLLNTVLTVEENKPNSHRNKGWEIFTDKIIECLNNREKPIVFLLWGNNARKKREIINNSQHYVIESSHPSPFSYNYSFKGSKPFSKTNELLARNNLDQIKW